MIYDFRSEFVVKPFEAMPATGEVGNRPVSMAQSGYDVSNYLLSQQYGDTTEINEFLLQGFRALDEAMKMYWSGMRVPTKDSYRFCRVKVAGGDKSLLIWRDDLINGRVRLPVMSLVRGKYEWNKDRYSPPIHPMSIRPAIKSGNKLILTYRPTPWLVDYTLDVWTEFKRDVSYIDHQILTRFNQLAVFHMFDGHLQGDVTMHYKGHNEQTSNETAFDEHRLVKHQFSITAEAWLPLPERIVPAVVGHVFTISDENGSVLLQTFGNGV